MRRIDHTGDRFDRLEVIEPAATMRGKARWLCLCDCGNETIVEAQNLRSGHTKSCGCMKNEVVHGGYGTRTYRIYHGMLERCNNPNRYEYPKYGGNGIIVCDRWNERNGFQNFIEDMGECPDGLSIDRIDNTGNYEPDNCRWTDSTIQNQNSSISKWWFVDGVRYNSKSEAARVYHVTDPTIVRWCNGHRPNSWWEMKYS